MQVSETLRADVLRRYLAGEGHVNDLAKELGLKRHEFLAFIEKQGLPSRAELNRAWRDTEKADREKLKQQPAQQAAPESNGWENPDPVPVAKAVKTKSAKAKPKRKLKPKAKPPKLVQHVLDTIESELTKLDKQEGVSSQDRERASRSLKQMVASLEKAVEMQRAFAKDKTRGGGTKDKEMLAHAEDIRRRIAERMERLRLSKRAERSTKDDTT